MRHPLVSEVQVFGIPDEKLGEVVCAWVTAKPGETLNEKLLSEFCQGQIAHFKVPRHIRIVDEIPMTVTGKPQKFVMQDKMLELLGKASDPAAS